MKKSRVLIGIVVLALILSGCAKAATSNLATDKAGYDASRQSMEAPLASSGAPATAPQPLSPELQNSTGVTSAEPAFEQMIIMNADLSIAVDDPGKSMAAIQALATGMGGFTVSSSLYKTQTYAGIEVMEATITVRVPAEKLNDALAQIKAMTGDAVKYTLTENITGQDVTQNYTDLKSRLRNLQEADVKLSELYDKAVKTEDALAIYNQKVQVTEQIEVIKGQMQYYEQASAKSAITVRIVAKETIAPITVAGWQPEGVARDAVQALINFGKGLVNFLIWLGILIIPIVLVLGLPIFFFVRWLVRRNRRNQAAKQEAMMNQKPPFPGNTK
jgi:hypothetical protein